MLRIVIAKSPDFRGLLPCESILLNCVLKGSVSVIRPAQDTPSSAVLSWSDMESSLFQPCTETPPAEAQESLC